MLCSVSSKDIQKARQSAKRSRASLACASCKIAKTKCSDYRPCKRCSRSDKKFACSEGQQTTNAEGPGRFQASVSGSACKPLENGELASSSARSSTSQHVLTNTPFSMSFLYEENSVMNVYRHHSSRLIPTSQDSATIPAALSTICKSQLQGSLTRKSHLMRRHYPRSHSARCFPEVESFPEVPHTGMAHFWSSFLRRIPAASVARNHVWNWLLLVTSAIKPSTIQQISAAQLSRPHAVWGGQPLQGQACSS